MKHTGIKYMNQRRVITVLVIILMAGILIYSMTLLLLNTVLSATPKSFIAEGEYLATLEQRWAIRSIAEKVIGVCMLISGIGGSMMVYDFIKAGKAVTFKKIIYLFGGIAAGMLVCTGVFSVIDTEFAGDYFFPLWSVLAYLVIGFAVVTVSNFMKLRQSIR